jgi:hypothetical protein
MGTISKKYQFGWFGACDGMSSAEDLSLNGALSSGDQGEDRAKLDSIIRISDSGNLSGRVFEKFTPYNKDRADLKALVDASGNTFDYFFNNNFQTLECGVGYIVAGRGSFADFNIDNFYLADETGYISDECGDVVCTETGLNVYNISTTQVISDQANGVVSTGWSFSGAVSLSGGDDSAAATPTAIDVMHDGQLVSHVTYTGSPASDKIYLSVTSGPLTGKCLVGTIANNLCNLEEK